MNVVVWCQTDTKEAVYVDCGGPWMYGQDLMLMCLLENYSIVISHTRTSIHRYIEVEGEITICNLNKFLDLKPNLINRVDLENWKINFLHFFISREVYFYLLFFVSSPILKWEGKVFVMSYGFSAPYVIPKKHPSCTGINFGEVNALRGERTSTWPRKFPKLYQIQGM